MGEDTGGDAFDDNGHPVKGTAVIYHAVIPNPGPGGVAKVKFGDGVVTVTGGSTAELKAGAQRIEPREGISMVSEIAASDDLPMQPVNLEVFHSLMQAILHQSDRDVRAYAAQNPASLVHVIPESDAHNRTLLMSHDALSAAICSETNWGKRGRVKVVVEEIKKAGLLEQVLSTVDSNGFNRFDIAAAEKDGKVYEGMREGGAVITKMTVISAALGSEKALERILKDAARDGEVKKMVDAGVDFAGLSAELEKRGVNGKQIVHVQKAEAEVREKARKEVARRPDNARDAAALAGAPATREYIATAKRASQVADSRMAGQPQPARQKTTG